MIGHTHCGSLARRSDVPGPRDFNAQLAALQPGEHLCLVYERADEQLAAAVPYVLEGLRRNERCVYIADELSQREVRAALLAGGVDVDLEETRGALMILGKRDAYLRRGHFDPALMIDFLRTLEEEALNDGFSALRLAAEMTWALGPEVGSERLVEYEARLNRELFPGSKTIALCQYNRARFPAAVVRDVLRSHPIVVLGDEVCPNAFYEPPQLMLGEGNDEERVRWMTDQLHGGRKRERTLLQAVHDRDRLLEQLDVADRRKDEFLAMLAHELRNPLAPIVGAAELLDRTGALGEQTRRPLEVIRRQVGNLRRLVDDLLDVSRITRGKVELRTERLDICTSARRALEAVQGLVQARGHVAQVTCLEDSDVEVIADPTRLEQVLVNLLNNAAKYTPTGGHLDVTVSREDGRAVVRVRDDGVGIPEDALPHIFEIFAQAPRSLARSEGGLGVGLSLVRELVEMHGGSVEAQSEGPGQGSTFTVRLPLAPPAEATATAPVAAPRPDRTAESGTSILVVDDNVDAAETLGLMLEMAGHQVRLAHDGASALALARDVAPDLVFLDIGLPELDGFEVARRLRAEHGRTFRIVALSGYGQASDFEKAATCGFDQYLVKPASAEDIEEAITA